MTRRFSIFLAVIVLLAASMAAQGQRRLTADFKDEVCDSLSVLLSERTGVEAELSLKSVSRRGKALDFHFTGSLGEVPWRKGDVKWFRSALRSLFPDKYRKYSVGKIFCKSEALEELVIPEISSDGEPISDKFRVRPPGGGMIVTRENSQVFPEGLSGRHIALWQSHGRYFEAAQNRWEWQRAQTFTTVEDCFTQSFVLPFLIPMLENAGAYVMTPRERDTQWREIICDNDLSFADSLQDERLRRHGFYYEKGRWNSAGEGFADKKKTYSGSDNPFLMGSARLTECSPSGEAAATWEPVFKDRGEYAVYVSYKTLPNSTSKARYTVRHLGGENTFIVNQKMGGSTWIYLGTFEFGPEEKCLVRLDSKGENGTVVSADAVRFGGGMGKIARGCDDTPLDEWTTSGLPAYLEGAIYSMQYAGIDSTLLKRYDNDYTADFGTRGAWVGRMSGGSKVNPDSLGRGIPFDAALAFHSDAGLRQADSTVGTLVIYTLKSEGSRKYAGGGDRLAARQYADFVQSQVCDDIRAGFDPEWARRQIWERSYSESRTSVVPCILLESLSHQNFNDMRYGLDPAFRFTLSRAVYKGILKFLSARYGVPYSVQPLPVRSMSLLPSEGNTAVLSWKAGEDPLEETAAAEGYIVYTRIDGGAWNQGSIIKKASPRGGKITLTLEPGRIYSFKVAAYNKGGLSFPSEILSAGIPKDSVKGSVLVVNNFTRTSAPAWFDTPTHAGFDSGLDMGVPYIKDISHVGRMYEFDRSIPWEDDDNPGFGASYTDEAGRQYAGNSFDYPSVHGEALMACGYAFYSCSAEEFARKGAPLQVRTVDLVCGKQVTVPSPRPGATEKNRFEVFPRAMREQLRNFTSTGGGLIVSGANIMTDIWGKVYSGVQKDSLETAEGKRFAREILGCRMVTSRASRTGTLKGFGTKASAFPGINASFRNTPGEDVYCVENPDGLAPATKGAAAVMRYGDSFIGAAVTYESPSHRAVSFGFPLETVTGSEELIKIFGAALDFLEK